MAAAFVVLEEEIELIAGPKMIIRDYSNPFREEIRENKVIQLDRRAYLLICFMICRVYAPIENAVKCTGRQFLILFSYVTYVQKWHGCYHGYEIMPKTLFEEMKIIKKSLQSFQKRKFTCWFIHWYWGWTWTSVGWKLWIYHILLTSSNLTISISRMHLP